MLSHDLSPADLAALASDPSTETRAAIIAKVARHFQGLPDGTPHAPHALEILKTLANDKSVRVRQSLAESVKSLPRLPREVALKLASDAESIAAPVLKSSPVFLDDDLITLIDEGSTPKQVAVAIRPGISEAVSSALVAQGKGEVVEALLANADAVISESALRRIEEEHTNLPSLQQKLAERASRASQMPTAEQRLRQMRDMARAGDLTALIVLRAACLGDLTFLQDAIAVLSGLEPRTVAALINDRGLLGVRSALMAARLPLRHLPAFRIAVEALREAGGSVAEAARPTHAKRVLERILTQADNLPQEDTDELLRLLSMTTAAPSKRGRNEARRAAG